MIIPAKAEAPPPTVFVLEIDGQPMLAFRAATFRQARELGKEDWLQEDLKRMMIGHRPLWDGKSPIRVRRAEPAEEVYYVDAKTENAAGDLPLVYLVQRDDEMDTAGPVIVDHFRPGDDFEVTPYRRTGATCLTNEIIATYCTDATFQTTSPVSG